MVLLSGDRDALPGLGLGRRVVLLGTWLQSPQLSPVDFRGLLEADIVFAISIDLDFYFGV